ncbi:MAG: hypothetical protein MZW92_15455 [Comamonadaceae bacterium]|nr:hypothetical protein [Comamonadaceae bacterium]
MHGKGVFYDPRLNDRRALPGRGPRRVRRRAQRGRPDHRQARRRCTSTSSPSRRRAPPRGSFDAGGGDARRGALQRRAAKCATCHVPPLFTEPGWNMHTAGGDRHRRLPVRALARTGTTAPRRSRVCGRTRRAASTMTGASPRWETVVEHYDDTFGLGAVAGPE